MVDEEKLIQAISQAIPVALHCRYIYLCEKNSNETITPKEHKELIKLIDKVEMKNVERIKKLRFFENFCGKLNKCVHNSLILGQP